MYNADEHQLVDVALRTPLNTSHAPRSYRDATSGTHTSYMATMPTIKVGISSSHPFSDDLQRIAHIDTGANLCLVSRSAYERDFFGLLEFGDLIPLHGHTVCMANGAPVEIAEMVQGARLVIGRAFYEVDLYIIPDCAHDYILSMGFMVTYGASLDMRRERRCA